MTSTVYTCKSACCSINVQHGGPHGKDWLVRLNGSPTTVAALAKRIGVEGSTIRKRIVNHRCLAMAALPRGLRGQKAEKLSVQSVASRFASLRW